jgi:hypothetical protein
MPSTLPTQETSDDHVDTVQGQQPDVIAHISDSGKGGVGTSSKDRRFA